MVLAEEIKEVVFQLGALKAPGSDAFFQKYWHLVGTSVIDFVQTVWKTQKLPEAVINKTITALLPKQEDPERVPHFRPIALCNVIVLKVITKIITNRIKEVIFQLVGEHQASFILGRQASDNIILVHTQCNKRNKKKKRVDGNENRLRKGI